MSPNDAVGTVVVGVDGSKAAINAALWAIDEAISRDVPLRLIHVVEPKAGADRSSRRESCMRQTLRSRPPADR